MKELISELSAIECSLLLVSTAIIITIILGLIMSGFIGIKNKITMEAFIDKIIELTREITTLRLENKRLKEECKRYKEMNDYYYHKYKGNL